MSKRTKNIAVERTWKKGYIAGLQRAFSICMKDARFWKSRKALNPGNGVNETSEVAARDLASQIRAAIKQKKAGANQ